MSFADVEKCDTNKKSKRLQEGQVDEKNSNNEVDIDFRCFKCGLHEKCQYFGRNPPFVSKQVEFSEDSFVMRDPFTQREAGRANFLLIGGNCGKCKNLFVSNVVHFTRNDFVTNVVLNICQNFRQKLAQKFRKS